MRVHFRPQFVGLDDFVAFTGGKYDLKPTLIKTCARAGVDFERAKHMLAEGQAS